MIYSSSTKPCHIRSIIRYWFVLMCIANNFQLSQSLWRSKAPAAAAAVKPTRTSMQNKHDHTKDDSSSTPNNTSSWLVQSSSTSRASTTTSNNNNKKRRTKNKVTKKQKPQSTTIITTRTSSTLLQDTFKVIATDTGVWTAVIFIVGEYLTKQSDPVGLIATKVGRFLQGVTKFPGISLSLCFLLSMPLPPSQRTPTSSSSSSRRKFFSKENRICWSSTFMKSYIIYLFRFWSLKNKNQNNNNNHDTTTTTPSIQFGPYAIEGIVGILTALKILYWVLALF